MAEINLTEEEQIKVESKRKPSTEIPKYFSANLDKEIPISRGFEQFLILQSDDSKQEAINWLSEVKDINTNNEDRDKIVNEIVDSEIESSDSKVEELENILEDFNSFRETFTAGKFSGVSEVGEILTDLQSQIGVIYDKKDRLVFQRTYLKILKQRMKEEQTNEPKNKQLESWVNPLSAYTG